MLTKAGIERPGIFPGPWKCTHLPDARFAAGRDRTTAREPWSARGLDRAIRTIAVMLVVTAYASCVARFIGVF